MEKILYIVSLVTPKKYCKLSIKLPSFCFVQTTLFRLRRTGRRELPEWKIRKLKLYFQVFCTVLRCIPNVCIQRSTENDLLQSLKRRITSSNNNIITLKLLVARSQRLTSQLLYYITSTTISTLITFLKVS